MALIVVGMGELEVSADPEGVLVTYALGSCIAVIVHDPLRRIGGMIHYVLPHSSTNPRQALKQPAMFADTGVPLLFRSMYARACRKADLSVKLVGGANLQDESGRFDIGRRNYLFLRGMLRKVGVSVVAEDVGGSTSRTVRLNVATGIATVRRSDRAQEVEL